MNEIITVIRFLMISLFATEIFGAISETELPRVRNRVTLKRRNLRSIYSTLPTATTLQDGVVRVPLSALGASYGLESRLRTPRNYLSYHLPSNGLIPYRRYRKIVPFSGSETNAYNSNVMGRNDIINPNQTGENESQLRFLGWLFGRPSYSRFPNYSVLEDAAGIGPYGTLGASRYPSVVHPESAVMVEDCTELLDPLTHEIIEDCHEVPAAIVPLGH